MAQTPKKPSHPAQRPPLTRRARSRHERELQRQRLVIIVSGAAIGLALLAVLIGLGYDRLWLPSRPVAQVNSTSLSKRDYWTERRYEIARRISQNLKNLAILGSLGPQFTQQLAGQIPPLNDQVADIRTAEVDEETVNGWIDRQLIIQGASGMNIQADNGEIAQLLADDLASAFPPPAPPPTTTATLAPSAVITSTAATTATTTAATTSGATATAQATETPAPSSTPAPTTPPTATPLPDAALQQQDGIVGRLFDAYNNELVQTQGTPRLTLDDFKAALHDQYLRQTLTDKIEAQLLPESAFTPSTDPTSIETRQILIAVTAPISATEAERNAAFERRKPEAEAILQQLRAGADFATLAQAKSDDAASKDKGGTMTPFDKDGKTPDGSVFDPAYVAATLKLKEGEISDLVRTPFGWHIIKLDKVNIDSKENQIKAARSKKFDEWLAQQRAGANIEHFPAQTPTPTLEPTPPAATAPLPTAVLYSTPTITPTVAVTGTAAVPESTPASSAPQATGAPAGTPVQGTPAPSAVLPTPIGTPKP